MRLDRRAPVVIAVAGALIALSVAGGGYSDLAIGVSTAAIWLVLLAGVLTGRLGASWPPALLGAGACLLGLLALTALSLSWTSSDGSGFVEVVRVAGYLGVVLLAGSAATRSRIGPVLVGVALGVVCVAGIALGSRLLGIGSGDSGLAAALPSAAGRLSYPIGYWNALGALMALALPVLVWLAAEPRARAVRAVALAGFAPPILVAYMASSRGALLAAALGIAVAAGFAPSRRRAVAAVAIGIAGTLPALAAASFAPGILDSPGDGVPGGSEVAVLGALLAGMLLAATLGERLAGPLSRSRLMAVRIPLRTAVLAGLVAATALIALAGPSALVGDLRSGAPGSQTERAVGIVSASGSGRAQFWKTALDAFTTEPVRGIGAGGFETYWNEHGSLRTPAKNAHSEPLEALAELGLVGLAAFLGFVGVVLARGVARARRRMEGEAAAAFGIVVAGLLGFAIDWTWQVPAVAVPVLAVAGLIVGLPADSRRRATRWIPAAVPASATVILAVAAIWAAGVLGVASSRMDASEEALAAGHLDEAAAAARTAASVAPWAAEPWLQLAEIEQSGGNLKAAQRAIGAAIRRDPDDARLWVVATTLQVQLGKNDASASYAVRAAELGLGAS